MQVNQNKSTQILRLVEVINKTGLSRSTIYAYMAIDVFPRPIKLGLRSVGWIDSEIETFIAERADARKGV